DGNQITQTVQPYLVPKEAPIARVDGVLNAVMLRGSFVGDVLLVGRGAGGGPTASAVAADLVDIARGIRPATFGVTIEQLKRADRDSANQNQPGAGAEAYYLRLLVTDKPGVFADIAASLRDHHISLETVVQRAHKPGEAAPVVITTHKASPAAMRSALASIAAMDTVLAPPQLLPIMDVDAA
ncbi:MAG: ACT domain-containing protein, partial [Pseudomonadota bacterium]